MKVKSESEVAQSCPIFSDPMDCSLPGSSAHEIFQARVLEWGAITFSQGSLNGPHSCLKNTHGHLPEPPKRCKEMLTLHSTGHYSLGFHALLPATESLQQLFRISRLSCPFHFPSAFTPFPSLHLFFFFFPSWSSPWSFKVTRFMYDLRSSNQELWDNLEWCSGMGGKFKTEGTYVHL